MPKYLNALKVTSFGDSQVTMMSQLSFGIMCFALLTGAGIILYNLFKARSQEKALAMVQG